MKIKRAVKSTMLRVRLSEHESEKLQVYADSHGVSISHIIREYIRRLPNPKAIEKQNV